jgi:hypothetical protein
MSFYPAPRWTSDDFEQALRAATAVFRQERLIEPADLYNEAFLICRRAVVDLFRLSANLTRPLEVAVEITSQPMFLEVLRYLTGPPVSEDDLKVMTGASLAPARLGSSFQDEALAARAHWPARCGVLGRTRSLWLRALPASLPRTRPSRPVGEASF